MPLLEDRTAVVTGAGRGIGRAVALTLAREGARVVINDLDEAPAAEVAAECEAMGSPGCAAISAGSVADSDYTDELMAFAASRWPDSGGAVDILVNNAGMARDRVVHKMTGDEWDLVIAVNLKGTFHCIRSAAPYMRDVAKAEMSEHGEVLKVRKIVNFFSTAAIRGNPGQINYTAAKMGNVGITRTIAQEWGRFRICVNAVAPGFTDTRMTKPKAKGDPGLGVPAEHREATIRRIPFGRIGAPQDIANAVLFFSSPLSDYVTGQQINVSGGMQIP